jgi:hypothetical protein
MRHETLVIMPTVSHDLARSSAPAGNSPVGPALSLACHLTNDRLRRIFDFPKWIEAGRIGLSHLVTESIARSGAPVTAALKPEIDGLSA